MQELTKQHKKKNPQGADSGPIQASWQEESRAGIKWGPKGRKMLIRRRIISNGKEIRGKDNLNTPGEKLQKLQEGKVG